MYTPWPDENQPYHGERDDSPGKGGGLSDRFRSRIVAPVVLTTLVAGYIASMGVQHVHFHFRMTQLGYRLAESRHDQQRLHQDKKRLTIETTSATDPGTLRVMAMEELEMRQPGPGEVRRLRVTGEQENEPGSADGTRATASSGRSRRSGGHHQ